MSVDTIAYSRVAQAALGFGAACDLRLQGTVAAFELVIHVLERTGLAQHLALDAAPARLQQRNQQGAEESDQRGTPAQGFDRLAWVQQVVAGQRGDFDEPALLPDHELFDIHHGVRAQVGVLIDQFGLTVTKLDDFETDIARIAPVVQYPGHQLARVCATFDACAPELAAQALDLLRGGALEDGDVLSLLPFAGLLLELAQSAPDGGKDDQRQREAEQCARQWQQWRPVHAEGSVVMSGAGVSEVLTMRWHRGGGRTSGSVR
ncbi:MAG: hypothetical protein CVU19_06440 [Betaproteobacteria bacterium HGW-Betaproteobacteria-13]|nr:MAG: hypothetical protein CVU19_06440 [Betaproteobacteria bacterium HGW-Betaproteobacteria-13]